MVLTIFSLCIFGVPTAAAEVAHIPDASFSVAGNPISIAVDESTGHVYVLNSAGNVLRYDTAGAPVNFSALGTNSLSTGCAANCRQIAVDNSGGVNQGVIYVAQALAFGANRGVYVFLPTGRPGTKIENSSSNPNFEGPFCGTAVDPDGVVYATHGGGFPDTQEFSNFADTYKPDQILSDPYPAQVWPIQGTFRNLEGPDTCRAAVDGKSHLYVTADTEEAADQFLERPVYRYTVDAFGESQPAGLLIDTTSTGIAVDQSANELYSNRKTSIARFDENGDLLEVFGGSELVESGGIAASEETGTVYAANRLASTIWSFTTVVTPDVDSLAASASQTTAELSASVGTAGAGDIVDCDFEYGTTTAFEESVPCEEAPPFSGNEDVSASITGLEKESVHHYRVVLTNANGTTTSPGRTFTTHNVAGISTDAPSEVTQTSATLNGSFDGNGEVTSYHFEWGLTPAYGNTTPSQSAGSPVGPASVSAPITGLNAYLPESDPYHFRLVATNGSGTTVGPDRTFFAAPPHLPAIDQIATGGVTRMTALLSASINPGNGPTVYWVEYGSSASYGDATPASAPVGADEADYPVSTELGGLRPGSTYHYRFVASNFGGTTVSTDRIFNTPDIPRLTSLSSSGVAETSAFLGAVVNPGFSPTTYRFDYGLTRSYGASTPVSPVPIASNVPQPVQVAIGGLKPGITYHYRVVATNAEGVAESADQTLTTVPTPVTRQTRTTGRREVKCRKGFVKKRGKCQRRKSKRRKRRGHREKSDSRRNGNTGGAKR